MRIPTPPLTQAMGKQKTGNAKVKTTSKAKTEVKTRQKSLKAAKEAAKVNQITRTNGRRSTSVSSASSGNDDLTLVQNPATQHPKAGITSTPSRAKDLFDIEMSEEGTIPPPSDSDKGDDATPDSSDEDEGPEPSITDYHTPTQRNLGDMTPRNRLPTPNGEALTPMPMPNQVPPTPSPLATSRATTSQPRYDSTPTPNTNQPATPSNVDVTNETDKDLKEIHKLLVDSSKTAPTGEFRLNIKTFSIPSELLETAQKKLRSRIQWDIIRKPDLMEELLHTSSNSLDMMSQELINQCSAAAEGREHKLGYTAQILVEKGYKWLFKLMSFSVPKEKQPAWITHAIRSVLSMAGISLSNMLASVDLCEGEKNPHQWTLVSFTKEAYDAFTDIRLLFDPRSHSAISVREWTTVPPRSQIFSIGAVVSTSDTDEEAEKARECLEDTVRNVVKDTGVIVTRSAMAIAPKSGKVKPVNIHLQFKENVEEPFFIPPAAFSGLKVATPMGTRVASCKFGRLCPNCGSDSHVEKKECPWVSFKVGERTINFDIPRDTIPGRTVEPKPEPTKKRKREPNDSENEEPSLPKMKDARPKPPPMKRQKVPDPKERDVRPQMMKAMAWQTSQTML